MKTDQLTPANVPDRERSPLAARCAWRDRGMVFRCFRWDGTRSRAGQPDTRGRRASGQSPIGTVENSSAIYRWVPGPPDLSPVRDERIVFGVGIAKQRPSAVPVGRVLPVQRHPSDESPGYFLAPSGLARTRPDSRQRRNRGMFRCALHHPPAADGDRPRSTRERRCTAGWTRARPRFDHFQTTSLRSRLTP